MCLACKPFDLHPKNWQFWARFDWTEQQPDNSIPSQTQACCWTLAEPPERAEQQSHFRKDKRRTCLDKHQLKQCPFADLSTQRTHRFFFFFRDYQERMPISHSVFVIAFQQKHVMHPFCHICVKVHRHATIWLLVFHCLTTNRQERRQKTPFSPSAARKLEEENIKNNILQEPECKPGNGVCPPML
jgi:hypothetical protein